MNDTIKDITNYLFDCNFTDDAFDPEGAEVHLDKSRDLMEAYPWIDIIQEWHNYLYTKCNSLEKIINFANLFYYYEGAENYNPEPYKFLGYLYANVDMDRYWDQAGELFESISITMLERQLLINTMEDPYYNPLKDPKIVSEIKKWHKSNPQ